jgi:hypothetical protein
MPDFKKIYASNIVNLIAQKGDFPVEITQELLGHARSNVAREVYVKSLQDKREMVIFAVIANTDSEK